MGHCSGLQRHRSDSVLSRIWDGQAIFWAFFLETMVSLALGDESFIDEGTAVDPCYQWVDARKALFFWPDG